MKYAKLISLITALLLLVSALSACSKFEYDNSTIYAKVTAIDGQKVTMTVGTLNIDPTLLEDGFGSMSGMTPPSGYGSYGEMPDFAAGETMPDMGDMPDMENMPDRENMQGMMSGGMDQLFTAGEDSITLTLNEDTVKTLSVGSIVEITFGDGGSVEALTVLGGNMQGDFSFSNFGGMTPPTGGSKTNDS